MKKVFKNMSLTVLALLAIVMFSLPASVAAATNMPPVIDSIAVTPQNPTKYNDLTCSVDVSDVDGNLDYVQFTWYLNGAMQRQTNKLVYGTDSWASDTLSGTKEANDYVVCEARAYDFERAYDRETHAVRVGAVTTNSVPQISYVDITPRHPNPQQDLTCSVFATDADDNLDHVIFEWLVNERMIRTAAKQVMGTSDVASDTLDVSRTKEGDWIRCRTNVYDASGTRATKDSVTVVMGGDGSTPPTAGQRPIAILMTYTSNVDEDEMARFSGHSSYDPDGGLITQYMFDYGDGQVSSWQAEPGASHEYSTSGVYYVSLKVKNDKGLESDWSDVVAIRVGIGSGGTSDHIVIDDMSLLKHAGTNYVRFECKIDAFDKSGDLDYVRFKWYVNGDFFSSEKVTVEGNTDEASDEISLQTTEEDSIKCEATVYDKKHNSASATRTTGGYAVEDGGTGGCSMLFTKFDYVTYLIQGNNGWVSTEVQNTGSAGTVTIKLYVDGLFKEQYSIHLASGAKASKRFDFALSVGTHKIAVESYMTCGAKVNKTTEITVFPVDTNGFVPTEREETTPEGVTETSVKITPSVLDIEINKGDFATVYIESPAQAKFTITVEGLPDNWANYPGEVDVKGAKTAFIYIVPKEVGNYNFVVKVAGAGKTYEQNIALYAAPEGAAEADAGGITGLISGLEGNWVIGLAIVAILAVLTALYFVAGRMKKGKKYEDHVYGERKTPYYGPYQPPASRMMKGSASPAVQVRPIRPVQSVQVQKPQQPVMVNRPAPVASIHSQPQPPHLLGRWLSGRYSDGAGYPKYGSDFIRR